MNASLVQIGTNRRFLGLGLVLFIFALFSFSGQVYYRNHPTDANSQPLNVQVPSSPDSNSEKCLDKPLKGSVKSLPWFDGTWNAARDSHNRLLSAAECDLAFPALYADVDRAVKMRSKQPITQEEMDRATPFLGSVKGYIYDQQVYVLENGPLFLTRPEAILQAIHRAVMTSPEPLPNIEFVFGTVDNMPNKTAIWGVTHDDANTNVWLMPDFGFWSWPEPKVSSFEQQQRAVKMIEEGYPKEAVSNASVDETVYSWDKKDPRLAWRGAVMGFNVRQKLVDQSKGHSWADVRELNWSDHASLARDRLTMAEHCRYKFVAQTEGYANSGRLKHLHNCRSVVFAPRARWKEHFHSALRSSGPEQNFVEVEPDWSDLEPKIEELLKDDAKAKRIADNNVKTFRERYLSLAAETCYWRKLIRSWHQVSFEPDVWEIVDGRRKLKGVSVEDFLLLRTTDWEAH
ncbi:MAG: hypothetical protein M4579_004268 [Chaenotheca gracillima]|nr:MAG: hypothetical protein M4579_004268 [Chaenotheca gracillima]